MTIIDKPSVLILGGTDLVGRHLVHYLVTQQLASSIRVADKMLPQTAYLSKQHEEAFQKVEFKQANLVNPGNVTMNQLFHDV
jgi:nucleoside-diphosphate-sugar epimerase